MDGVAVSGRYQSVHFPMIAQSLPLIKLYYSYDDQVNTTIVQDTDDAMIHEIIREYYFPTGRSGINDTGATQGGLQGADFKGYEVGLTFLWKIWKRRRE